MNAMSRRSGQRELTDGVFCEAFGVGSCLGNDFTAADILMSTVYRQVRKSGVLDAFPRIRAYRERCEARPGWLRTVEAYEKRLHVAPGTAR